MSPNETHPPLPALVTGLLVLGGCLSNREQAPSVWPPEDFQLEVEASRRSGDGTDVDQRLQVWADGLVVYQEADKSLTRPGVALSLPVFRRMCAYRLGPESVRALSREIRLLRLDDLATDQSAGGDGDPKTVTVQWRGFGNQNLVRAVGRARYPMARLLRVINAYAPRQGGFFLDSMGGEPQDRRVEQVPEIVEGEDSCLTGYLRLIDLKPDDLNLLMSAYALTLEGAGAVSSATIMDRLRRELAGTTQEQAVFPEAGVRSLVEQLEAFLPDPPAPESDQSP